MKLHVQMRGSLLSRPSAAVQRHPLQLAACSSKRRTAPAGGIDLCARGHMARARRVRYQPPRAVATMTPASVVTSSPGSNRQEDEATLGPVGRSLVQQVEVIPLDSH